MKKATVLFAALLALCYASNVHAAGNATAVTPAAASPAATPATPQQNRMKSCAAQYHQKNIAKSQYHTFMSQCLKTTPTATTKAPTVATAKVRDIAISGV